MVVTALREFMVTEDRKENEVQLQSGPNLEMKVQKNFKNVLKI